MDIITVPDLASYLRDPSVTDDSAATVVDLANDLVTEVIGESATITATIRAVTYEVAARAFRNPEGYSSETVDDYTYRRDSETRRAGVYLTSREREELGGTGRVRCGWLA